MYIFIHLNTFLTLTFIFILVIVGVAFCGDATRLAPIRRIAHGDVHLLQMGVIRVICEMYKMYINVHKCTF